MDPDPPRAAYPDCPVVDCHVHVLPPRLLDAIREWFEAETAWTIPPVDTETVVRRITRRTDGLVFFPYAHEPGVAASMNEAASRWQQRLDHAVGLGTVHAADDRPGDIARDVFELGLQGIKLHCPVQGFPPDDERLDPVYESLVARDAPLVVHASTHPFYRGNPDLGPGPLRRVLERFPRLRVCVPHLGLFETADFLDLADEYRVRFDTAVALGDATHERIGLRDGELPAERLQEYADRVMFGTDYPIRPLEYETAISSVREVFTDRYEDVFYRNARQFYGLDTLEDGS